jgi:predicted nucleic acid-binding protein
MDAAISGRLMPLISVPLVLEYEAVLTRPEHLAASGYAVDEALQIVIAFCRMGEPVHLSHRLRPRMQDPNDEFVLETAFHGRADVIVTFNRKDFEMPARIFGIRTDSPKQALERLNEL